MTKVLLRILKKLVQALEQRTVQVLMVGKRLAVNASNSTRMTNDSPSARSFALRATYSALSLCISNRSDIDSKEAGFSERFKMVESSSRSHNMHGEKGDQESRIVDNTVVSLIKD